MGLVRATVACVRAVLTQESISDARADAALDAAERWTVGEEDIERVRSLADRVWNEVAAGDMPSAGAAAYNASISMVDRGGAYVALDSLGDLLADRTGKEEALAMLATLVRSWLPCPEFEPAETVV